MFPPKSGVVAKNGEITMPYAFIQMEKNELGGYLAEYQIIACRVRNSRLGAKRVAVMELFMALLPVGGIFLTNGPLYDVKGFIAFMFKKAYLETAREILNKTGYCDVFYLIDLENAGKEDDNGITGSRVWKGRAFNVSKWLEQSREVYNAHSPHNRPFKLAFGHGEHNVKGYRGDGSLLGRRALPVEDSRCLVNLAAPAQMLYMVDPFAGAGGITHSARFINPALYITTVDIDPSLAPGLAMYGDEHHVNDAAKVAFLRQYDAIVTELPFAEEAGTSLFAVLCHVCGYLKPEGRMVVMCSSLQYEQVLHFFHARKLLVYCANKINRKGTDAAIIAATFDKTFYEQISPLVNRLATIS
jgi:hypothetical protein